MSFGNKDCPMAVTILEWLNRIFPNLLLFFGVGSIYDGVRLKRIIRRDGGTELSRTLGIRQTSWIIGEGILALAYSLWRFLPRW
jgi:hypothetical protein